MVAITPIIPHIAKRMFKTIKIKRKEIKWPKFDKKFLVEEFTNIVIQINGKKKRIDKNKNRFKRRSDFSLIKR